VNGNGIYLENHPIDHDLHVGAIVVATGFRPYEPRQGELGYGEHPEVMTLPQLIRMLASADAGKELRIAGRPVRNMALIHCVGSRQLDDVHEPQPDGNVNAYCSRVCCTASLAVSAEIRHKYPQTNIFDVYEDIRTYGRDHENYYDEAAHEQVRFLRYHVDDPPTVIRENGDLLVRVTDHLTWGTVVDIPVELVVLAVGMMPNPVDDLIDLLKIPQGSDRFLLEVHPKLRPVETVVPGVVLTGTAQSPMNIQETCAAAAAAAAKVAGLLGQGEVTLDPFVARVDLARCNGTGECVNVCAYEDAIRLDDVWVAGALGKRAVVTPANCSGCGACVGVCPNQAIDIQGWTIGQYDAMVDAISAEMLPVLEAVP
jgi:heterodisulfide reductase subunit A